MNTAGATLSVRRPLGAIVFVILCSSCGSPDRGVRSEGGDWRTYSADDVFAFSGPRDLVAFRQAGEEGELRGFEAPEMRLTYSFEPDEPSHLGLGAPPNMPDGSRPPSVDIAIDGLPTQQTEYRYTTAQGDGVIVHWVITGLATRYHKQRRLVIVLMSRGANPVETISRLRSSIRVSPTTRHQSQGY